MIIKITESQLNKLKLWTEKKGKLYRKYNFETFESLVKFFDLISKEQIKQNHHAELVIKPNMVEIFLIDHEEGKVSEKCHKLAKSFENIYTKFK